MNYDGRPFLRGSSQTRLWLCCVFIFTPGCLAIPAYAQKPKASGAMVPDDKSWPEQLNMLALARQKEREGKKAEARKLYLSVIERVNYFTYSGVRESRRGGLRAPGESENSAPYPGIPHYTPGLVLGYAYFKAGFLSEEESVKIGYYRDAATHLLKDNLGPNQMDAYRQPFLQKIALMGELEKYRGLLYRKERKRVNELLTALGTALDDPLQNATDAMQINKMSFVFLNKPDGKADYTEGKRFVEQIEEALRERFFWPRARVVKEGTYEINALGPVLVTQADMNRQARTRILEPNESGVADGNYSTRTTAYVDVGLSETEDKPLIDVLNKLYPKKPETRLTFDVKPLEPTALYAKERPLTVLNHRIASGTVRFENVKPNDKITFLSDGKLVDTWMVPANAGPIYTQEIAYASDKQKSLLTVQVNGMPVAGFEKAAEVDSEDPALALYRVSERVGVFAFTTVEVISFEEPQAIQVDKAALRLPKETAGTDPYGRTRYYLHLVTRETPSSLVVKFANTANDLTAMKGKEGEVAAATKQQEAFVKAFLENEPPTEEKIAQRLATRQEPEAKSLLQAYNTQQYLVPRDQILAEYKDEEATLGQLADKLEKLRPKALLVSRMEAEELEKRIKTFRTRKKELADADALKRKPTRVVVDSSRLAKSGYLWVTFHVENRKPDETFSAIRLDGLSIPLDDPTAAKQHALIAVRDTKVENLPLELMGKKGDVPIILTNNAVVSGILDDEKFDAALADDKTAQKPQKVYEALTEENWAKTLAASKEPAVRTSVKRLALTKMHRAMERLNASSAKLTNAQEAFGAVKEIAKTIDAVYDTYRLLEKAAADPADQGGEGKAEWTALQSQWSGVLGTLRQALLPGPPRFIAGAGFEVETLSEQIELPDLKAPNPTRKADNFRVLTIAVQPGESGKIIVRNPLKSFELFSQMKAEQPLRVEVKERPIEIAIAQRSRFKRVERDASITVTCEINDGNPDKMVWHLQTAQGEDIRPMNVSMKQKGAEEDTWQLSLKGLKPDTYKIRVEAIASGQMKSDEAEITIVDPNKGAAFLVAINGYSEAPLSWMIADAEALKTVLIKTYRYDPASLFTVYSDDGRVMVNGKPFSYQKEGKPFFPTRVDKEVIENAFAKFKEMVQKQGIRHVILFYGGHGVVNDGKGANNQYQNRDEFILQDDDTIGTHDWARDLLADKKRELTVVGFYSACRNKGDNRTPDKGIPDERYYALQSCKTGERAQEDTLDGRLNLRHSLFVQALLNVLKTADAKALKARTFHDKMESELSNIVQMALQKHSDLYFKQSLPEPSIIPSVTTVFQPNLN